MIKSWNKFNETYNENVLNKPFQYNDMIDYTLLEESATDQDIIDLCKKANILGVKSVCVLPKHVKIAKNELSKSKVLVCTVVSFPGGNDSPDQKLNETIKVINDGADEVDMVLNYTLLKEYDDTIEYDEETDIDNNLIKEVNMLANKCHSSKNKNSEPITLKVIVESGLLTEYETQIATHICINGNADFIKTSTGKVQVGAEINKIKIMYDIIKEFRSNMKIKASGGIRTEEQINSMINMVDRFGMGYASVDKINGIDSVNKNNY